MPRRFLLFIGILSVSVFAFSQDTVLKNEDVVKMVEAGFSSELIVTMISNSPCEFATGLDSILALKDKNVPEGVIQAMLKKKAPNQPVPTTNTVEPNPANSPNQVGALPNEIGVYVKKDGQWVEILPEVINWKTGGVLKSIATVGIVKGDVNGKLSGQHSRNYVQGPLEFVIYAPEGVAITEYQFLRLREKKNSRAFRTVTGGVFHASGGSARDLVPFEGKKLASRTYAVMFPTLTPGEYGFLPPGAFTSSHASATLGKMYTFRLGGDQ